MKHQDWSIREDEIEASKLACEIVDEWRETNINSCEPIARMDNNFRFQLGNIEYLVKQVLMGRQTLLVSGTGTGKSFITSGFLDVILQAGFIEWLNSKSPYPSVFHGVILTAAQVVDQFSRDWRQFHASQKYNIIVGNYEGLRAESNILSSFINWVDPAESADIDPNVVAFCKMQGIDIDAILRARREDKESDDNKRKRRRKPKYDKDGNEIPPKPRPKPMEPIWNPILAPRIIICDEVQMLRRPGKQTRIVRSYADMAATNRTVQVYASATPFIAPNESKTVVLGCRLPNIPHYYAEEAANEGEKGGYWTNRCNNALPVIRKTFPEFISNNLAQGASRNKPSPKSMENIREVFDFSGCILQNNITFNKKSKIKDLWCPFQSAGAKASYDRAYQDYLDRKAKAEELPPQSRIIEELQALLQFQKRAELLKAPLISELIDKSLNEGFSIFAAFAFRDTLNSVQANLKIRGIDFRTIVGGQNKNQRWDGINEFQDDKVHVMLGMLKAGGVGLSLHHYEPRNTRERRVIMPYVWSIIDMLQGVGRCHRINNASHVTQIILGYVGTVEERVFQRVKEKGISLKGFLKRKTQLSDIFDQVSAEKAAEEGRQWQSNSIEVEAVEDARESYMAESEADEDGDDNVDTFNTDLGNVANSAEFDESEIINIEVEDIEIIEPEIIEKYNGVSINDNNDSDDEE